MRRIIQMLLLVLVVSACINEKIHSDSFCLHESEQRMEIPMADDVYYCSHTMRHFEDSLSGIEYLAIEDARSKQGNTQIVFYRLDSCKEVQRVLIPKQGPNSISQTCGFYANSLNEIYVSDMFQNKIYKYNSRGEVLDSYDYSVDINEKNLRIISLQTLFDEPLVIKDGCIYGFQGISYDSFKDSPDGLNYEFNESPIAATIDTATKAVEFSELCYPDLYEKKKGYSYNESVSRIYDGRRFIYSFCLMDELYVTEDHKTVKLYPANSRYMDVEKEGVPRMLTIAEGIVESNSKAIYDNIVYDKYRQLYYRFCRMKNMKLTVEQILTQGFIYSLSDFSIMILNSDLEVVGETKFEAGVYAPKLFFVNKDGLWLSENNYQREDMTDDVLKFRCLKVVENEE